MACSKLQPRDREPKEFSISQPPDISATNEERDPSQDFDQLTYYATLSKLKPWRA